MNAKKQTLRCMLSTAALVASVFAAVPASAAPPTCRGVEATIVGTSGPDTLIGTDDDDVIVALGGHDRIQSRGGYDLVCAGEGDDVIDAGASHDSVYAEGGDDVAYGGPYPDGLRGGAGNDRLYGGAGYDTLRGDDGRDRLFGGALYDQLHGNAGVDHLDGGGASDYLDGGGDADVLYGRDGNDRLFGAFGPDRLYGGGGSDELNPGRGRGVVHGGPAGDRLNFETLDRAVDLDLLRGDVLTRDGRIALVDVEHARGTGYRDVMKGDASANTFYTSTRGRGSRVDGRGGNDELTADTAVGGAGDDHLYGHRLIGDAGNDVLRLGFYFTPPDGGFAAGGDGDDRISVYGGCSEGCAENVRAAGGPGVDRLSVWWYSGAAGEDPFRFDLPAGTVTQADSGFALRIFNLEEIVGTDIDDVIIGTDGPEYLMGGPGDDVIEGRGGDDVLAAGTRAHDGGMDTISAGAGRDLCYSSSPPQETGPVDEISGCERMEQVSGVL